MKPRDNKTEKQATACEPDNELLEILGGNAAALEGIFSKEKIRATQQMIDDAKLAFFTQAQGDMDTIGALTANKEFIGKYDALYRRIFQPLCNIKGQAEIFGFTLIACICKYLIDYCEDSALRTNLSDKDMLIITQLTKALQRSFEDRIVGSGGDIEKELEHIIHAARR